MESGGLVVIWERMWGRVRGWRIWLPCVVASQFVIFMEVCGVTVLQVLRMAYMTRFHMWGVE